MGAGDNQAQKHKGFKWTRGDESNPTLALLVDNTSQALHLALANDFNTDWNVSAYSDPTVLIHCAGANAATDYISIWHDDTDATIDAYGATALNLGLAGTNYIEMITSALYPTTTNTMALGTSALNFTDIYLDSGGVIYFDATDVLITHSANKLTISGGDLHTADATGVVVGHTTQVAVSTGDGSTALTPEAQVLGTAQADGSLLLATTATANAIAPTLAFLKSGGGAIGSASIAVADNEYIGRIIWFGADGTDLKSPAAEIRGVINGTPGTGDMPGSLEFYTTADAGETLTVALTLEQDQKAAFGGSMSVIDAAVLAGPTGNNKTFAIQVGSSSSTALSDIIKVSSATLAAKRELGFFGATPVAQATGIAAAVTAATFDTSAAAAVNALIAVVKNAGLAAAT